jgi:hypothetical protein
MTSKVVWVFKNQNTVVLSRKYFWDQFLEEQGSGSVFVLGYSALGEWTSPFLHVNFYIIIIILKATALPICPPKLKRHTEIMIPWYECLHPSTHCIQLVVIPYHRLQTRQTIFSGSCQISVQCCSKPLTAAPGFFRTLALNLIMVTNPGVHHYLCDFFASN